jgi:hypothetical protein
VVCFDKRRSFDREKFEGIGTTYAKGVAMQEWIEEKLETSDLGDKCLDKRFKNLVDSLSQKPTLSIPVSALKVVSIFY